MEAAPEEVVISGRVFDATKRTPLTNVEVYVNGRLAEHSDRDGHYRLQVAGVDSMGVTYGHSGFRATFATFPLNFNEVEDRRYVLDVAMIPTNYRPTESPANAGISYGEWRRLSSLEFDCNRNNIHDQVEIDRGELKDENKNGIPDVCEQ